VTAVRTDVLVLPASRIQRGGDAHGGQRWARSHAHGSLQGLPCIGVCLGMQLFFEVSEEGGASAWV